MCYIEYVHIYTRYALVHTIIYINLNVEPCITGISGGQCDARKCGSDGQQQPGDPGSDEDQEFRVPKGLC
jgi:hypothetical protein